MYQINYARSMLYTAWKFNAVIIYVYYKHSY